MCAQFHPSEDLVVSASLDQTVRVWDISGELPKFRGQPSRVCRKTAIAWNNEVVGSEQENVEYSFSCNVFAVSRSVFASEGIKSAFDGSLC